VVIFSVEALVLITKQSRILTVPKKKKFVITKKSYPMAYEQLKSYKDKQIEEIKL